jgi:hypothetical protein
VSKLGLGVLGGVASATTIEEVGAATVGPTVGDDGGPGGGVAVQRRLAWRWTMDGATRGTGVEEARDGTRSTVGG